MAKILTAKEGYVFFNGETGGKTLILGKNENSDKWRQITDQEFEEFLRNQGGDGDAVYS